MKNEFKNDRWLNAAAALLTTILALGFLRAEGQSIQDPPVGRPDAVIDLASHEGVQLVNGQWRYHDVKIEDADSRSVGPDLTHVASREFIAAGTFPNTREHLGESVADPQAPKPGNNMPASALASADFQDLLEYLDSLK